VVSRALLVYLRKEGLDAAIVSEDPVAWPAELTGRPFSSRATAADAVILSPTVNGQRRRDLCRTLRGQPSLGAVPIIALRDAGDEIVPPASAGAVGGALRTSQPDLSGEAADVSLSWPYRLREVLGAVDTVIRHRPHTASA
jgi:hypothetical protein